jgi:hypothetical protein
MHLTNFCYKENNTTFNVYLKTIETEEVGVETKLQKRVLDIILSSLRISCMIFSWFSLGTEHKYGI